MTIGMLFNEAGRALYCPYGLNISVPAMMAEHLTLFGLVEFIFTVAIFAYVNVVSPGIIYKNEKVNNKPIYIFIAVLIAAVPLGLLAEGTAWGEWGADEIAEVVEGGKALGYTPAGMLNGFEFNSIMPDYTLAGMPDVAAYILSAIIGVAILMILFKVVATISKDTVKANG